MRSRRELARGECAATPEVVHARRRWLRRQKVGRPSPDGLYQLPKVRADLNLIQFQHQGLDRCSGQWRRVLFQCERDALSNRRTPRRPFRLEQPSAIYSPEHVAPSTAQPLSQMLSQPASVTSTEASNRCGPLRLVIHRLKCPKGAWLSALMRASQERRSGFRS